MTVTELRDVLGLWPLEKKRTHSNYGYSDEQLEVIHQNNIVFEMLSLLPLCYCLLISIICMAISLLFWPHETKIPTVSGPTRFTKNLSPDKINLSAFKGEGELTGLELDEIVLTDLLELPSWVRLTSAWCNKVAFRIQWTKLKNVPIYISLDEVKVQIETCEELRSLSAQHGLSAYGTPTKYNFINKVIDGMTIFVNLVSITFKTPAFTASVQIMQILVESKSPEWKREELPQTRVKDKVKEQILIFKELKWETLRLEASSIKDQELPPLRLLTNKSRCRLTIKKRMSDCFVMGCKLLLILENLLWVLTDSQLKAVLHFAESLSGLVQKANETTRIKKAARKLEMLPEYQAQISQQARMGDSDTKEQLFASCDVIETSYHFLAHNINLHLSDDPGAGRSLHPLLGSGSNVHLQVSSLQVDYYPYHLAAPCDRKHWARYNEANSPHVQWLNSAQNLFKNSLLNLIQQSNKSTPVNKGADNDKTDERSDESSSNSQCSDSIKNYVLSNLAKVMTSCLILRVDDFTIYRVTTNNSQVPKEFIKGDRDRYTFPAESTLHAEFTYYYYPGDIAFPLPSPKFYVQINPVVLNFDAYTLLWLNAFALNLHHSLKKANQENSTNAPLNYIDVRIEAIMPRVIFESAVDTQCGQRDRPKSLHIQISRALISNVRSSDGCSRADLSRCINACQMGSLFFGTDFPCKPDDPVVIPDKFVDHIQGKDNVRPTTDAIACSNVEEFVSKLSKTLLWTEARDIWCINLEPIWGDFYGARGVAHNRPVPFLDAFPLKLWVYLDAGISSNCNLDNATPQVHGLAYVSNLVSLQLNHYQLLFLLRLADDLTEVVTVLEMDSQKITKGEGGLVVLGAVIPQLEITMVMPSQTPGKESSGADLESVIPDTSSLADDIVTNPSIQWNTVLSTNLQDGGVYKRENTTSAATPPSDQISYTVVSPSKLDSPKALNSLMGLSSVKKGLSNLSNFFEGSPFKGDDVSDSGSVRPDSSDSDYCLGLKLVQGDMMFRSESLEGLNEGIDFGSEALEEDEQSICTMSVTTPSENPSNTSYYKRKDLISIATVKLGQVEFTQQSLGLSSTIKAHVSTVSIDECPAIPWDEFQNKFNTRSRGWTEVCEQPSLKPRIKIRREHEVVKSAESEIWTSIRNHSLFNDMLTAALSNIDLTLNASTLSSFAEFFIDDIASPPLPLKVELEKIAINLVDDKTESNAVNPPVNLNISRLYISRSKDGIFNIEPSNLSIPNVSPTNQETVDLKQENEQLRRRLAAMERLTEENHRLRKCEEEAQELRSCLNDAQDTLTNLLHEKESLLEVIRNFQNNKSDRKQQSSGKR